MNKYLLIVHLHLVCNRRFWRSDLSLRGARKIQFVSYNREFCKKSGECKMSIVKECCTLPAVESKYTPRGSEWQLGDLDIYETQDKSSKRLLISVYDIFGMHPNTKQFCDILAEAGFRVAMPDFFRGQPISMDNFPPKDMAALKSYILEKVPWDNVVKKDLENLLKHYANEGVTSFGMFGFCWGGKIACLAAAELSEIKASGLVHPSMIELSDADGVKCPMILLPSKDEPDMVPFYEKLKERFGDSCSHVLFEDMHHGFAAARGDFDNELNRKRVKEAIHLLAKFFNEHVK